MHLKRYRGGKSREIRLQGSGKVRKRPKYKERSFPRIMQFLPVWF